MIFTGTYEHAIDAKNRLAIPAEVRQLLVKDAQKQRGSIGSSENLSGRGDEGQGGQGGAGGVGGVEGVEGGVYLYVTLSKDALSLYTEAGFEQRAVELDQSQLDTDTLLEYERFLFSQASRVELDSAGRVRLPERLLQQANLSSDVVLLGVKDHLEVRDRQSWLAAVKQLLEQKPGILMNPRRAMRPPPTDAGGR